MVDFFDLPVADIPLHNAGLAFDEAMRCLAVFAGQEALAGLVVAEFNPDHGAEDGSTTDALVRGLVDALVWRTRPSAPLAAAEQGSAPDRAILAVRLHGS